MKENGVWETIFAAMSQAFFTLSIGIGSLAIFGSYIGKERALLSESINITVLDTVFSILAGLIIFPACFAFNLNPGQGPGLIFVTLPNVFNAMSGGRVCDPCSSYLRHLLHFQLSSQFLKILSRMDLWIWQKSINNKYITISPSCLIF